MSERYLSLGVRDNWGGQTPLLLSRTDRRQHLYLIGQTGVGKSSLIRHIVAQDIAAGEGCAVIDPHGDLADEVLDLVPRHRVDDVVYLDPSDIERPVGFNPFYRVQKDERALVAANITATFKHSWRDSWGPRLEYILYNTVAALLDAPDHLRPSFLSIPLVLVRREYRDQVIKHIEDPRVLSFFVEEMNTWPERQLAEAISPVQNKIGQFLSNPFVRNMLGQWRPTIDLGEIMKTEKILVVRIPKGTLGEEPSNLFGSLIVSGFQHAAMQRVKIPERERSDFHLHIDEFQNFTTDTFASILSESRKVSLTLLAAHQYVSQLPESISEAVFGNVGTMVAFRVSGSDADRLAKEMGTIPAHRFSSLQRGEICVRLARDGELDQTRIGVTIPHEIEKHGHGKNIKHQSRMRYGADRKKVEARIHRWLR